MKLHLLGIFHTLCQPAFSHCAFTGKVFRFAKMMQECGYDVVEYANESTSEAWTKVPMLSASEVEQFTSRKSDSDFHGDDAVLGSELWKRFDSKLQREFASRFDPDVDIVCHPFGRVHEGLQSFGGTHVETGIGYPHTFLNFRIFESYAWKHYHAGKAGRGTTNYEWVVPNYFDLDDWQPCFDPGEYLLYFGRICHAKGLSTVVEIARRTKQLVVICGQGDPTPFSDPNVHYLPPICGPQRSELLRHASALLMPTNFIEPFGGSGVEGLLCGTPLIAVDSGAFTETVLPGFNGWRCHTLGDWMEAVRLAPTLDREAIATTARMKYSLETVGAQYDRIFNQLDDLRREGWYSMKSHHIV